ncbi:hypothetical protein [Aporhodopirellula aestuarii]|uniref:Biopolymer transporter ExbD n=1 Tax=Aporhodopirellula aestuarii TaxID=2950107 RepID=A0ABT0U4K1_9BACT|nr:hypothetical protein [Aporhodopirellula aestuarii]MCM2371276.1 hypothetical protein [Aporhodopirellula aestuarii]
MRKSIQFPRQQSAAPSHTPISDVPPDLPSIAVEIDEHGSFLVLGPDWQREAPGKQSLLESLKDAIGGQSEPMRLVVQVHGAAKLQYLVDCLDAGSIAGFAETRVSVADTLD